jgi:hypothetical protein
MRKEQMPRLQKTDVDNPITRSCKIKRCETFKTNRDLLQCDGSPERFSLLDRDTKNYDEHDRESENIASLSEVCGK